MNRSRILEVSYVACTVMGLFSFGCSRDDSALETKSNKPVPTITLDPPAEAPHPTLYVRRDAGVLSFTQEIAPIIYQKCSACHHVGGIGPFSLVSYQDVKKRAKQIVEVTQKRIMPPWAPLLGYCEYDHDNSLSMEQVGLLAQWEEEGCREGDPAVLPPHPVFVEGWKYGTPDLVVTMPEPFQMPANTTDIIRKFVIRVPIHETKYVRAFDFQPGNTNVVHHMRLRIDPTSASRTQDRHDPMPGFDGTMITGDREPDGFFLVWIPGYEKQLRKRETAWALPKGTDLVLELHLHGSGKEETVQSSIALYFSPTPPRESQQTVMLESCTIDIPAGKKDDIYRDQFVLPVDVELGAVLPHAHYLARKFNSWAVLPDGEKLWLMRMDDWDFNWQRDYTYQNPVALPKGTTLCMEVVYDNSAENPRNPHVPPRRVMIGRETFDEMAEMIFEVFTHNPVDEKILAESFHRKTLKGLMDRELFLIQRGQAKSETHYNLGWCYSLSRELPLAQHHYLEAIRLNPKNVLALNNLGTLKLRMGQLQDATELLQRTLEVDPQDYRARSNLGIVLLKQGRIDQAEKQFLEALRISPEFAEAELNLGQVALTRGNSPQAVTHLERALQLNPDLQAARLLLQQTKSHNSKSR